MQKILVTGQISESEANTRQKNIIGLTGVIQVSMIEHNLPEIPIDKDRRSNDQCQDNEN